MTLEVAIDARCIQDYFPGIGRYAYQLIEGLAQLPNAPRLSVIYNPHLPDTRYNLPHLAQNYPDNISLVASKAKPFSVSEQYELFLTARTLPAKVWHAPYYIRPYALPLPSVLTVYDLIGSILPQALPNRRARLLYTATTRLALASSRGLIAISEATALDLQHVYRIPEKKIAVIPLAASAQFNPMPALERQNARQRLNLPEQYLLYVGINKPHKNLARLVQAFARLPTRYQNYKLVLAGKPDPRYAAPLHALVKELNLANRVIFYGAVAENDLPAIYNCAELFVFPSQYEGFGLPLLEAMACGVPVISANNSSLPEIGGQAALYFSANATAAITDAMIQGLENMAELSQKSLRQAAKFSWQRTAELTLAVYRELA